ncbi:unnamed protein product [Acanthosepion pharaonis]|uniref:FHA domain-containing protein n=1 Tax=Acanthosepion pharaonis TaxID=158019 RepID=A0A812CZA9_ACAPH|nr:unnamed protein product [Sepia pharaonis]
MRSAIPYKEPTWGGLANRPYSFDVLKNGSIVDNVDLNDKSYYIFGRLPTCDVTLEHPSLSRYHACIQNCATPTERYEAGWYLYDLDSTHGTWINKGPDDDQEEESELSITELKMQREKHKRETELFRQDDVEEDPNEVISRDDGCMWGIDMANVTDDNQENPFAQGLDLDESFYIDDPKNKLFFSFPPSSSQNFLLLPPPHLLIQKYYFPSLLKICSFISLLFSFFYFHFFLKIIFVTILFFKESIIITIFPLFFDICLLIRCKDFLSFFLSFFLADPSPTNQKMKLAQLVPNLKHYQHLAK